MVFGARGVLAESCHRAAANHSIATEDIRIGGRVTEVLSAASAAVSDIRQFCVRQPNAWVKSEGCWIFSGGPHPLRGEF